jgi:hypothetical protein
MRLRRLKDQGMEVMGEFLDSLNTLQPRVLPKDLLTDETTSALPSGNPIEIEGRNFSNRFEAAEYLDEVFAEARISDVERDVGLWAWLTLFYFDQVCPADATGRRRAYERARYIPDPTNYRKYYRHLLAGPYRIYRAYGASPRTVWPLLCGSLDRPGEIVEQICAYQEMVTNAALMAAVTAMYIDPATDRPKRGTGGKGPGSPRRLPKIVNQFDVTWDLYSMTPPQILKMLPQEFDRWKPWDLAVAGIGE